MCLASGASHCRVTGATQTSDDDVELLALEAVRPCLAFAFSTAKDLESSAEGRRNNKNPSSAVLQLMQETEKEVAERSRTADDSVRVGLQLQEQNARDAADLQSHRSAASAATADLRALKTELDSLIKAVGAGVDEAAAGEVRAQECWHMIKEHIAKLAAGGRATVDSLAQPAIPVLAPFCPRVHNLPIFIDGQDQFEDP
jgi:hypothetical protein